MKYFLLVGVLVVSTAVADASPEDTFANISAHRLVMRHGEVRLKTGVRVHYVEQGDPNGPREVKGKGEGGKGKRNKNIFHFSFHIFHDFSFVISDEDKSKSGRQAAGSSGQ